MELKHTQIDPFTASIEEIEAEIMRLSMAVVSNRDTEQGVKVLGNSIYGMYGFQNSPTYLKPVAEAVTLQCQTHIIGSIDVLNDYFTNKWASDAYAHEKIRQHLKVKGIDDGFKPKNLPYPVVLYADTDSVFLRFGDVMKLAGYKGDTREFIFALDGSVIQPNVHMHYKDQCDNVTFGYYLNPSNNKPYLRLEFEEISDAVFQASKRYVKGITFDNGKKFDVGQKIKVTGLDTAGSNTPPFAKEVLLQAYHLILTTEDTASIVSKMSELMHTSKERMKLVEPDTICKAERISNYDKWVVNDKPPEPVAWVKRTQPPAKGAAAYNYMLTLAREKGTASNYRPITSGTRVRYYATRVHPKVFGYPDGEAFPKEFAPPIDYETQFTNTILNPVNNLLAGMGLKVDSSGTFIQPLF